MKNKMLDLFEMEWYNISVKWLPENNDERNEVDIMAAIKPIQATPELSGKDATKLLKQADKKPTAQSLKKNNMLHSVLMSIRKV